jgi:hypothetical protein
MPYALFSASGTQGAVVLKDHQGKDGSGSMDGSQGSRSIQGKDGQRVKQVMMEQTVQTERWSNRIPGASGNDGSERPKQLQILQLQVLKDQ